MQLHDIFEDKMVVVVSNYNHVNWQSQVSTPQRYKMQQLLSDLKCSSIGTENIEKAAEMCLKEVLKDIGVSGVNVSSSSLEDDNSHAGTSSSNSSGDVIFSCNRYAKWLKDLHPFISSVFTKPDVLVEINLTRENGTCSSVPILVVEVHSKKYGCTLAKLLLSLIDQLRFLRHVNIAISKCTGFVFPSQKENTFVTKMVVTWTSHFYFEVTLDALQTKQVKEEVKAATEAIYSDVRERSYPVIQYFMPLSQEELLFFGNGSQQKPSRSSILLVNNGYYYKLPSHVKARFKLCQLLAKGFLLARTASFNLYDQPCLPIDMLYVKPSPLAFMKFTKVQHSPLTVEEAKCCLRDLIPKVCSALDQLHRALEIAHLDVRLENLCCNAEMNVVLVDLDRWEPVDSPGYCFCSTYLSVMYEKPEMLDFDSWIAKHSDFKQFGLMCWWIICGGDFSYHQFNGRITNSFVEKLYKKGEYDQTCFSSINWGQEFSSVELSAIIQARYNVSDQ